MGSPRVCGSTTTFSRIEPKRNARTICGGRAPVISVSGTAASDYNFIIQITTGATLASGNARFKWSSDGGATYTSNVTVAATVVLGTTGITAAFAISSALAARERAGSNAPPTRPRLHSPH